MSFVVHQDRVPEDVRRRIPKELVVRKEGKQAFRGGGFAGPASTVEAFEFDQDHYLLPYAWAISNLGVDRKSRDACKPIDLTFTGTLREIQRAVKPDVLAHLNKKGSVILSLYPGAGKTAFTIYLSTVIKMQTLVIAHRVILINQFRDTIARFVPGARVQVLKPGTPVDQEADYLIVNAESVEKFGFAFDRVGLVIVDEVHCIATRSMIKSLLFVSPRYLIGLSATPYRSDGLDRLLDLYFGPDKVTRGLQRRHTYVQLHTGMEPEVEYNADGTINWNSVLSWQAANEGRNRLIVDITQRYQERNWLILCKRKEQGRALVEACQAAGDDVTYLMADKNDFNVESRIVVVTVQKCGVGFSHDKLDGLIIASDVEEYFIQYLGRVFRTEEGTPLVIDLVDKHKSLQRHATTRKKVAVEALGDVHKVTLAQWTEGEMPA